MDNAKTEHHGLQIQIKEDDKFFCRLLSKEDASLSNNTSFRLSQIAIPFLWESHPGTPKHNLSLSHPHSLPPLTPPPSFYNNNTLHKNPIKKNPSRSKLFRFLFQKLSLDLRNAMPSSSSSSFVSSSSLSSSSSDSSRVNVVPENGRRRRRSRFLSCDSSVEWWENDDEEEEDGDNGVKGSTSTRFCFGIRRTASSNGGSGSRCRRQG